MIIGGGEGSMDLTPEIGGKSIHLSPGTIAQRQLLCFNNSHLWLPTLQTELISSNRKGIADSAERARHFSLVLDWREKSQRG